MFTMEKHRKKKKGTIPSREDLLCLPAEGANLLDTSRPFALPGWELLPGRDCAGHREGASSRREGLGGGQAWLHQPAFQLSGVLNKALAHRALKVLKIPTTTTTTRNRRAGWPWAGPCPAWPSLAHRLSAGVMLPHEGLGSWEEIMGMRSSWEARVLGRDKGLL